MSIFRCPYCKTDITKRAEVIMGEACRVYMPYELRVLCPECGKLTLYKLDWHITLRAATPVENK